MGYFISTWIVYVASIGGMHPMDDSPSFDSQDECRAWLIEKIDKDEMEIPEGKMPICWPDPANTRVEILTHKGVG